MIKGDTLQMYTITEISKMIGVSRQAIYKKIDREELQPYLKDSEKGKVITEKGLTILKGFFSDYLDSKQVTDNERQKSSKHTDNLQTDYIQSLKSEIDHLKSITTDQSQQIGNLTQLLQNSQILLKQQQDKILLLENPIETKRRSIWSLFKHN